MDTGTKKVRNPECRNGRARARDCEGATRSTHVSQINYQHSGIRGGIERSTMRYERCREPALRPDERTNERICWIWRGIYAGTHVARTIIAHATSSFHPLRHIRRRNFHPLKGKSSIRASIRVRLTFLVFIRRAANKLTHLAKVYVTFLQARGIMRDFCRRFICK